MNYELETIWKEAAVAYSRYYPDVLHVALRKTTENLSQESWFPGRGSN
jgi:hypothetical protein